MSPGGRIISAVLMVAGFILMALVTAAIASLFVREEEEPGEESTRPSRLRSPPPWTTSQTGSP